MSMENSCLTLAKWCIKTTALPPVNYERKYNDRSNGIFRARRHIGKWWTYSLSRALTEVIPIYYTNRKFITLVTDYVTDPYTEPNKFSLHPLN